MRIHVEYGSTAARLFTGADALRIKTHGDMLLERDGAGAWWLSLYRDSSTARGKLSRDVYALRGDQWHRDHEDMAQKYDGAPMRPSGAERVQVGTFAVWCVGSVDDALRDELRRILSLPGFA